MSRENASEGKGFTTRAESELPQPKGTKTEAVSPLPGNRLHESPSAARSLKTLLYIYRSDKASDKAFQGICGSAKTHMENQENAYAKRKPPLRIPPELSFREGGDRPKEEHKEAPAKGAGRTIKTLRRAEHEGGAAKPRSALRWRDGASQPAAHRRRMGKSRIEHRHDLGITYAKPAERICCSLETHMQECKDEYAECVALHMGNRGMA